MAEPFKFCPMCTKPLHHNPLGYVICGECRFIHSYNAVCRVTAIIPMVQSILDGAGIHADIGPDGGLVSLERGFLPFEGKICLPCGIVEPEDDHEAEVVKMVLKNTGLHVRVERLLCVLRAQAPHEEQHINISYLCRPWGGKLLAGSGAKSVKVIHAPAASVLCFLTHRMLADAWFGGEFGDLLEEGVAA